MVLCALACICTMCVCSCVQRRAREGRYPSLWEFEADFRTMFQNARKYNHEDSFVYHDSVAMEAVFDRRLKELLAVL